MLMPDPSCTVAPATVNENESLFWFVPFPEGESRNVTVAFVTSGVLPVDQLLSTVVGFIVFENASVIVSLISVCPAVPPACFVVEILVAVGATPSMTRFLLAPSEPAVPGVARVSVALFVAASLIVPPFKASDVVVA